MIVVQVADPYLRRALCRAAHPEEDVVLEARLAAEALEFGFPRLVVRTRSDRRSLHPGGVEVLEIDEAMLNRWESERRMMELPPTRLDHLTGRLESLMARAGSDRSRVDRTLADLSKATGAQLPVPLRTFARRVMEFPAYYTNLRGLAHACGTSRGALKAKFRRRGLSSPHAYLRWFRLMAVADMLSDREVTVAAAASRLGFTSDGNLCRMMSAVAGMTPTEARTVHGWSRMLLTFSWTHLTPEALEGWASLDTLFVRRVA